MPEDRRGRSEGSDIAPAGTQGCVTGRILANAPSSRAGCTARLQRDRYDRGMLVCEPFVGLSRARSAGYVLKSGENERNTASGRSVRVAGNV
jgi:hypothetical protein